MSSIRNTLFFLFLIITTSVFAQNTDSLKKLLTSSHTPGQQLALSYFTGSAYANSLDDAGLDSSIVYIKKAITLATAQHNDSMLMECYGQWGKVMCLFNGFKEARTHYRRALKLATTLDNKSRQLSFLIGDARVLNNMEDNKACIGVCQTALALAHNIHQREGEAEIKTICADIYIATGRYDIALEYLNDCIKVYDSLKNYSGLPTCYQQISRLYGEQKQYKEALKYALIMDSLYVKTNSKEDRYGHLMNIGIIYKNLGDYDKAIEMYNKSLAYFSTNRYVQVYIYIITLA